MTRLVAYFSNGYSDPYKGRRNVKAAWMLTTPEGIVYSGHSRDRAAASKTARSTMGLKCPHGSLFNSRSRMRGSAWYAWANETAKKYGFTDWKAYNAAKTVERDAWLNACKIEIVDVVDVEEMKRVNQMIADIRRAAGTLD